MSHQRLTRDEALELMRRHGMGSRVDEAARVLPDVIDVEREQPLLARFGMSRTQLIDRAGGNP